MPTPAPALQGLHPFLPYFRPGHQLGDRSGAGSRDRFRCLLPDLAPAWSPDGRKIAFEKRRVWGGPAGSYVDFDVYVVNADGSGQRRLTRNAARDSDPVWSPNGRKIAFMSSRPGNSQVYVINADGSRQRRLTQRGLQPVWSPDGRRIAFVRSGDVYMMNADGSGSTENLTRSPWNESWLAWSPGRKEQR